MKSWTQKGFEALAAGTPGDGGSNLYVSRKGRLQRILRFDTNNSGYTDILITNSHEFNEKPFLHLYDQPLSRDRVLRELRTDGSRYAAVADFNGDGYDGLVIVADNNGHISDLPGFVYYGSPDGLSEDHKIEIAAPACIGVAAGDFNGDGRPDIALISNDGFLRIYYQTEIGFVRNGYVDKKMSLTHLAAGDVDGDGFCDLYCREKDGEWFLLWGSAEGISAERTRVGPATDDGIFQLLPPIGGNLGYPEAARPKILHVDGRTCLLYCERECAKLIFFAGREPGETLSFPIPAVISATAGNINGDAKTDLVFLSRPNIDEECALVYLGSEGYAAPLRKLPARTARDVLIDDFSGNGFGDIAICQGRELWKYTAASRVYPTDANGISAVPVEFITHDAVNVLSADTTRSGRRQLIFCNHQESDGHGDVPVYIYTGGPDGYRPDRRYELRGLSPGSMLPADLNDDGWPDILLFNDAEDTFYLEPPSYVFWGSEAGFSNANCAPIPTRNCWGGLIADINRDGHLDIVSASLPTVYKGPPHPGVHPTASERWGQIHWKPRYGANSVTIHYGSGAGFLDENRQEILLSGPDDPSCGILWPALADLNGNGWLDLVVPYSLLCHSVILWGGPDGFAAERATKLPVERAVLARVADLNNDGYPDIIFGTRASIYRNINHQGSVVIFWGSARGYSADNCCELPCFEVGSLTIGDVNGDGWLDLCVGSYFNARERDIDSYIYWNDHGHFSVARRQRLFSHSCSGIQACDYNEDGYIDLMVTSHRAYGNHRAESAIWWNGPDGFKEENRTWLPTLGPHNMCSSDIGNILNRGPEEYYLSAVLPTAGAQIRTVRWEAEIPPKAWVAAQVRAADTAAALEKAPFVGPDGTARSRFVHGELASAPISGKLLQYKLYLGAVNGGNSPIVTEVEVLYD